MATQQVTISVHPTSYDTDNYSRYSVNSSYPIANAYSDSDSTTYAQINLARGSAAETYYYFKFDLSSIPDGATIKSITAKGKGYINATSSSIINKRQMQMATGTTLKGSAITLTNTASEETFTDIGSWTLSELKNATIRFYAKRTTNSSYYNNNYYLRVYGATLTVTYEIDVPDMPVRVKQNGAWVTPSKVLVKQSGAWSEATKILAKDGGVWK